MSEAVARFRRRQLIWMGAVAAVAVAVGAASLIPPAPPKARAEAGALVLPEFASRASDVALVMITTKDEFYHLAKDPEGWVLPEKGRYPVRADRIEALVTSLGAMRYDRAMTRDDRKFDRIGLGDPTQGGTGALVEVGNGRGENFAKLIVGYRDGRTYVRAPDDLQAWAVTGAEMPPLQRGARWLDLEAVSIAAVDIAEVDVRPGLSSYRLTPADEQGTAFQLAPPNQGRVAAGFGLTLVAQALTRFSPVDVAQADSVAPQGPVSVHVTRTKGGLEIITRAWRSGGPGWVAIAASARPDSSAEAAQQAEAINARTRGWAFALTETDWGQYVMPLEALSLR